tara:strand:- start:1213 stop:1632 length:420 start_codon:yes stop_codon:yes gene_type:complete
MINLILPLFVLQFGYASITLDDGHIIKAPYVQRGAVSDTSGFILKAGDMADIQSSLHGNSCLIRVSEIKARFELETESRVGRCKDRLDVFRKSLDESELLNKNLQLKLKEERSKYKTLLIGSVVVTVALSAAGVYVGTR